MSDKTYTVTIIIENGLGESFQTYKHIQLSGLIQRIAEINLSNLVMRMMSDIFRHMKENNWI